MAYSESRSKIRSSSSKKSAALATLKTYEAICTASVLEDCADQLAILGAIMPGSYETRRDARQVKIKQGDLSPYQTCDLLWCVWAMRWSLLRWGMDPSLADR